MEQVAYALPGAIATYTAKSALFTASETDRGTFFDSTGSFTITIDTTGMSTGWSAWFRTVSGTQVLDPTSTTLINGATTYSVANAGDVVLVEYTGSAFVISHSQVPSTVAISGGTINGTTVGASTATTGRFTTVESTIATGTAPLIVASTTVVGNLNVSQLLGGTWAIPGTIGSTTKNTGGFTTLTANGATTLTAGTASTTTATGTLVVTGGVGVSGALYIGSTLGINNILKHSSLDNDRIQIYGSNGTTSAAALTFFGKSHATNANEIYLDGAKIGLRSTVGTNWLSVDGTTMIGALATTLTVGTASSSTTTGTLVVTGGVGISGQTTTQTLVANGASSFGFTLTVTSTLTCSAGATFATGHYVGTTSDPSGASLIDATLAAPSIFGDHQNVSSFSATTAMATGVGGGISFAGKYTSGGAYSTFASIKGTKANATDGNNDGQFSIVVSRSGTSGQEKLRCDHTVTAGNTAMMLWDVDNATLERVTVGAADSGGAGFKVLRIPN